MPQSGITLRRTGIGSLLLRYCNLSSGYVTMVSGKLRCWLFLGERVVLVMRLTIVISTFTSIVFYHVRFETFWVANLPQSMEDGGKSIIE